jgi:hypothetical protein
MSGAANTRVLEGEVDRFAALAMTITALAMTEEASVT